MKNCIICQARLRKQKTYCSRACLKIGYTGKRHSEESLKKMRGRKLSQETIARQSAKKTREHVRVEGDFLCQRCSKHFDSNTSLRAHMSYCSDARGDTQPEICTICEKYFKSRRSMLIHKNLKHVADEVSNSRRAKMVEAKKNCEIRRSSKAESDFFAAIKEIKPDAVRNFMIPGSSHVYDVYIPSMNTIIEFDGDFWHGNKKIYDLSDRMKRQFRLDEMNSARAVEVGYKVIRVWQSESSLFIENLRKS